jgi:C4-dicarboxylate-specific signal transduction histidine kinase
MKVERLSRRLDAMADVINELDLFARNANNYRTKREQVRLRTLLGGVDLELLRTRKLAEAPTATLDDLIAAYASWTASSRRSRRPRSVWALIRH